MPNKYDIAIIGGGIVGNAIARELSRYDLKIILIEKEIEVSFGTSKANSGIIHSGIHDSPSKLKGRLCFQGNILWEKLAKELRTPFERVGEILVARKDEDIPVLKKLLENAKANNIPAQLAHGDDLHSIEPNLSKEIKTGLLAPTAGVIPPYEMTYALYENAMQNGVEYLLGSKVTDIVKDNKNFIIEAGNKELRTDFIINAAGVHADDVAAMAGADNFKIKPRKGEEYILDKRLDNINNHVIFPTPTPISKGILVIKTIEGSTMIGPTAEDVADKEDTRTTEEGLEKILNFVRTMIPEIQRKDIIASFAGVRPVSDTNDFIIEESKKVPRFINAAGIQSPGLTAAPAIALMVADILKTVGLKLSKKKDFKKYDKPHRRLSLLANKEKELLIGLNKSYGNMICRCETVSEAEVVAAIRNGARTVDGIKFRTRAGMGRCQAGFCIHHVLKILSRELGIPEEEITKRGGDSRMLKEKR
ncbi:NAD(P)/FAD-dependent oxidoreductase [Candidatus Margulisiibacteriota bacterium]